MTIVLKRQPSGLEIIGNALAQVVEKKNEQAQQAKNMDAMAAVYDKLYNPGAGQNATPSQGASSYSFNPVDLSNPSNIKQTMGGANQNQNALTQPVSQQFPMPQSTTPGRNPFRTVQEIMKSNPNVSLSSVLPMAMQWEQEQKTKDQQTLKRDQASKAIAQINQAILEGKPASAIAMSALQYENITGNPLDKHIVPYVFPSWKGTFAPNGDFVQQNVNGDVRSSGNYAKPELPYDAKGGFVYSKKTGEVSYTKPTADRSALYDNNRYKADSVNHNAWLKSNAMAIMSGALSAEDSPFWPSIVAHLSGRNQQQMQPPQQDSSDPIGQWITNVRMSGGSPEQIKQKLRENGYGDRYDSWVW